jgi:hypothetical protein
VAYGASRAGKWFIVVDGCEGKEYDQIGDNSPVFSGDGKRVAYLAQRGAKWLVVIDGMESEQYDGFLRAGKLMFVSPSEVGAGQNSSVMSPGRGNRWRQLGR